MQAHDVGMIFYHWTVFLCIIFYTRNKKVLELKKGNNTIIWGLNICLLVIFSSRKFDVSNTKLPQS